MFDYVFQGSPTIPVPGSAPVLGLDAANNKLYSGTSAAGWSAISGGGSTTFTFGTLGVPLTNARVISTANAINLGSGDIDLYTVPANKKALVVDLTRTNPTGNASTISSFAEFKSSGVYTKYDQISASGDAPGTIGVIAALVPMLLVAGESFSVNTNNTGLSVWPYIVEFDATVPINVARLTSFSVGDNTLLTVPANGIQLISNLENVAAGSVMKGSLYYFNKTGISRTIGWNLVPSGGSTANGNQIKSGSSVSDSTVLLTTYFGGSKQNDFFSINTDANTAGQIAWVIYQTLP